MGRQDGGVHGHGGDGAAARRLRRDSEGRSPAAASPRADASALDGTVALRTSAATDQVRFDGGTAIVPSRDIRLDRIAFSRGRFALEAANGRALTLPVQSEIGRVIEDCR